MHQRPALPARRPSPRSGVDGHAYARLSQLRLAGVARLPARQDHGLSPPTLDRVATNPEAAVHTRRHARSSAACRGGCRENRHASCSRRTVGLKASLDRSLRAPSHQNRDCEPARMVVSHGTPMHRVTEWSSRQPTRIAIVREPRRGPLLIVTEPEFPGPPLRGRAVFGGCGRGHWIDIRADVASRACTSG